MAQFKESEIELLCKNSPDMQVSELSKQTSLIKSLTEVLNVAIQVQGKPHALDIAEGAIALSGVAENVSNSKNLSAVNFVSNQAIKTVGLTKIGGFTPARATVYVTLVMAEKIVAAAGFAELDKCKVAIASLAATSGMGAVSCIAAGALTLGIGCVAGAIAIAADAFNVYGQCSSQGH